MKEYFWLYSTKQQWKVILFLISLTIGIFLFIRIVFFALDPADSLKHGLLMLGLFLSSWLLFINAVKCPYCGYKPVWPLMRRYSVDGMLKELFSMPECPKCVSEREGVNELGDMEPIRIFEAEPTGHHRPFLLTIVGLFVIVSASVMLLYRILEFLHIFPEDTDFTIQESFLFVVNLYWLISACGTFRLKEWARKGMVSAPGIFILMSLLNGRLEIRTIISIISLKSMN